tara:strand:- start:195 stop:320 length:126 start_codon:yes stop_codon:yes gene_type:complete
MEKNYNSKNDLKKVPRSIVLKRILAFSKSYKNSSKDLKMNT